MRRLCRTSLCLGLLAGLLGCEKAGNTKKSDTSSQTIVSNREPTDPANQGGARPRAVEVVKVEAVPVAALGATKNRLPDELAGVYIGMPIDEFDKLRPTSEMEIRVAVDTTGLEQDSQKNSPDKDKESPEQTVEESLASIEKDLEVLGHAMDGTTDPNYDRTRGLHYLKEKEVGKSKWDITFQFNDGHLGTVIVWCKDAEAAMSLAEATMAMEPNNEDKWLVVNPYMVEKAAKEENEAVREFDQNIDKDLDGKKKPSDTLQGWVYKDRYVVADARLRASKELTKPSE